MTEQYTLCPPIPGPFTARPEWLPEGRAFQVCREPGTDWICDYGRDMPWPRVYAIRLPDSAFGEEFRGHDGSIDFGHRWGLCYGAGRHDFGRWSGAQGLGLHLTYRLLRDDPFYATADFQRLRVKPAEPEWIEWDGGECPVPAGSDVEVRWPDGAAIRDREPENWEWLGITHYRVWKLAEPAPITPTLTYAEWVAMKPDGAPDGVVLPEPVPAWMQEIAGMVIDTWGSQGKNALVRASAIIALQLAVREGYLNERKA